MSGELVTTCSPVARSIHALWRMPWWPGCSPVRIVVWLASVTVGSEAMAPWRYQSPSAISRATFGARPARAWSYSTLAFVPSKSSPITWWGLVPSRTSVSVSPSDRVPSDRIEVSSDEAPPRRASTVGAMSTSRQERSTGPRVAIPAPLATNGARAWTTPGDPCSPKCPPASGQWCDAVWTTQRSGADG